MHFSKGHSFDLHGFIFALKFLVVIVGAGAAVSFGSQTSFTETPTVTASIVSEQIPEPALPLPTVFERGSQRIINALSIQDAIPSEGKYIAADLVNMKLTLYENGTTTAEFPIAMKGRPGTAWETPSGFYSVQTKEREHFSSIGKVYMPYSMQFYGNYFIHGHTYYPDGTPTSATFSGGCIRLSTEDAEKVFEFADVGTKVFVYDSKADRSLAPLTLDAASLPAITADAYLVADIDTGEVYMERNASEARPMASITKLMTALVANETISFDKNLSVPEGALKNPPDSTSGEHETFAVGDLLYPLLMQSSDPIADTLASYYGSELFVRWMNRTARAFNMASTTYADPVGASTENTSTVEDLFRLAMYLSDKKSFIFGITHTPTKTITAEDGTTYEIQNLNSPAETDVFIGGKAGHARDGGDTMLSVVKFKINGETRRVAVIVLGSMDRTSDTTQLAEWIALAARSGTSQNASAAAASVDEYRKIEF